MHFFMLFFSETRLWHVHWQASCAACMWVFISVLCMRPVVMEFYMVDWVCMGINRLSNEP